MSVNKKSEVSTAKTWSFIAVAFAGAIVGAIGRDIYRSWIPERSTGFAKSDSVRIASKLRVSVVPTWKGRSWHLFHTHYFKRFSIRIQNPSDEQICDLRLDIGAKSSRIISISAPAVACPKFLDGGSAENWIDVENHDGKFSNKGLILSQPAETMLSIQVVLMSLRQEPPDGDLSLSVATAGGLVAVEQVLVNWESTERK